MFRRTFWFTTGAAAGVWATTRVQRRLRALAPDSLAVRAADRARDTGQRLRHFALDVRHGMVQREGELHDALGLTGDPQDGPPPPVLPGRAERIRPAPPPGRQLPPVAGAPRPHQPNDRTTGLTGKEDH